MRQEMCEKEKQRKGNRLFLIEQTNCTETKAIEGYQPAIGAVQHSVNIQMV